MRADELAFIGEDKKIEHLYVCWCAKEAVYKCNGQKEVSFVDNIFLAPFSFEHHGVLNASLHKNELNLDYTVGYMQYADYMIGYVKGDR
jgi:phosphopantetheinyl transferase